MCSEFVDAELFQNFALGESVDRNVWLCPPSVIADPFFQGDFMNASVLTQEARFLRWASVTIPENPAQVHPKLKNLVRRGVPDHHRREVWHCPARLSFLQFFLSFARFLQIRKACTQVWCCLSGASILRATRPDLMKKASAGAFRDIPFRSVCCDSRFFPFLGNDMPLFSHTPLCGDAYFYLLSPPRVYMPFLCMCKFSFVLPNLFFFVVFLASYVFLLLNFCVCACLLFAVHLILFAFL